MAAGGCAGAPFDDAAFDLVLCQFGACSSLTARGIPRSEARPEARRAFLFNVWDRIEENVFAGEVTNALGEIFPNDPPRFMARTPHGYHDTALVRRDLAAAGFSASRSRRWQRKAARSRRVPRRRIAKGRRCAVRSRREAPDCKRRPTR